MQSYAILDNIRVSGVSKVNHHIDKWNNVIVTEKRVWGGRLSQSWQLPVWSRSSGSQWVPVALLNRMSWLNTPCWINDTAEFSMGPLQAPTTDQLKSISRTWDWIHESVSFWKANNTDKEMFLLRYSTWQSAAVPSGPFLFDGLGEI